jgi:hypothetical protein
VASLYQYLNVQIKVQYFLRTHEGFDLVQHECNDCLRVYFAQNGRTDEDVANDVIGNGKMLVRGRGQQAQRPPDRNMTNGGSVSQNQAIINGWQQEFPDTRTKVVLSLLLLHVLFQWPCCMAYSLRVRRTMAEAFPMWANWKEKFATRWGCHLGPKPPLKD